MHTVHRAFPGVRIVTAAVDAELTEVRLPMTTGSGLGQVAVDGDLARVVALHDEVIDFGDGVDTPTHDAVGGGIGAGLRFTRAQGRDAGKEKLAWVVSPGMGHIGDRYYLS